VTHIPAANQPIPIVTVLFEARVGHGLISSLCESGKRKRGAGRERGDDGVAARR
jgi:hypothetical protein